MVMQRRGPPRGINKSDQNQSFNGSQGRGFNGRGRGGGRGDSNGQGRGGSRPQVETAVSHFNYSGGRGGLSQTIQVKRLPSYVPPQPKVPSEALPEVGFDSSARMDTTAPWITKTDNIPIKSPVENKPVPFGGNAAVAFQTQPDIVHEPTSKTIVECSASVMSGGTATSGINSGSVAPTNLSTSQCQGCTLLHQRVATMLRTAATTFIEMADAFQEIQQGKNNNN
ncbi:unnamed protein product [Meloidogyne enterolobii]|uniref:Uncharacterized protein n=2 Tax=Meloidogyne enterolobii TaxID=390850 RepID=A0ACB0Y7D0_MELEN